MNTLKRQNVAAIAGTRNLSIADATRIATANIAIDRAVEAEMENVPEHLTFLMLQTDLLSNETKLPRRNPRGLHVHRGVGKNARKRAERAKQTLDLTYAQRFSNHIGSTQADFD